MEKTFALRGDICYSKARDCIECIEDSWLVCEQGINQGVFKQLPDKYQGVKVYDYRRHIITPGLVDLHVHAPQYSFRALNMDMELIEWLNTNTFPEEAKYVDLEYAKRAYELFVRDLSIGATTRAAVFATLHVESTEILMDLLEESGIRAVVGKVNMDRNSPDNLREASAVRSEADTRRWLESVLGKYQHVAPILTPRFIPSCTDELMARLANIQREYHLPVQSHLSENPGEIRWVEELCPDTNCYGEAYDKYGLFGGDCPTIMAHCVYPSQMEIALMKERGVFIAHCPQSNTNLSSGIAPIRTYLDNHMPVGLGSDVAGGFMTSIFRAMADAIQVSKLRWRLVDDSLKPLTVDEAFYLGTKGGGAFFGKVGSFEKGYEFDALVLDDSNLSHPQQLSVKQRLERLIYLSDDRNIIGKFIFGKKI